MELSRILSRQATNYVTSEHAFVPNHPYNLLPRKTAEPKRRGRDGDILCGRFDTASHVRVRKPQRSLTHKSGFPKDIRSGFAHSLASPRIVYHVCFLAFIVYHARRGRRHARERKEEDMK